MMKIMYRYKRCSLELKDIDEKNHIVQIYVSAFGNEDSDGDIIVKGAYAKTIKERGPEGSDRIRHIYQHDPWHPIGMPVTLEENDKGLLVTSKLSNSTLGRDVLEDYKINMYEHSVGFKTVKEERSDNNPTIIKEIQLWEYSSVTWGANEKTPLVGIKGLLKKESKADVLEKLNDRMIKLATAISRGEHTDERLQLYEIELRQLTQGYNDIIHLEPEESTHEPDLEQFYKGLKTYYHG